jgi:4,5-DOPA dioxygenase extradiol
MKTAPALFVSHGAPTFALEPGKLGPQLMQIGEQLTGVAAILIVSAHWQTHGHTQEKTRGVHVMTTSMPETVHDFGGFPAALYNIRYPALGAPSVAVETAHLLTAAGYSVKLDDQRGLDHGAWVPLTYLFPRANVPVFQISIPFDLDAVGALKLGETLAPLRERGVMIIGSGSLTHNLYEFRQHAQQDAAYAAEFANWIRQTILRRDVDALTDYRTRAPNAKRAHPTEEHFLPLLVALGASDPTDALQVIDGGITHGVLSMDSFAWGLRVPLTSTPFVNQPTSLTSPESEPA